MKYNKLYIAIALLGAVLAGCQKEQQDVVRDEPTISNEGWTITVDAGKSIDTKALAIDGSKLTAYWKVDETVSVFFGGEKVGTLTVTAVNEKKATLSGSEITKPDGLEKNDEFTLIFPGREDGAWSYLGQDGSAPSEDGTLAKGYDYSTATVSVTAIDDDNKTITVSSADFANQQSIYRLGFKVGGEGSAIEVQSFTIASNQNKLVRTRTYEGSDWTSNYGSLSVTSASAPDGNLYSMALRNENTSEDDTYTFEVVGPNNVLYEGTKTVPSANLGYGKFLSAKSIEINQKAFAPAASGTISAKANVL